VVGASTGAASGESFAARDFDEEKVGRDKPDEQYP
jgi:hypothetical protein